MVLTNGSFASQEIDNNFGDIFSCHSWVGRGSFASSSRPKDSPKHPTMHRIATHSPQQKIFISKCQLCVLRSPVLHDHAHFSVSLYLRIFNPSIPLSLSLSLYIYIYTHTYKHMSVCVSVCTRSCPTLCKPMECSPLGSSVHKIFQTRILEWLSISYTRGYSCPRDPTRVYGISCIGEQILYH